MLVSEYFRHLRSVIDTCEVITAKEILEDERSDYLGFFKATLYFHDGTVLHVREYVFTRFAVEREAYVYHYQDENNNRIFRYDNTEHFPDLSNFPDHKHTLKNVVTSSAPTFEAVLKEITQLRM